VDPLIPADAERVYVDGSALTRYLAGAPSGDAWRAWAARAQGRLVTSPLGISELNRAALLRGDRQTAHDVAGWLAVERISDQAVRHASRAAAALEPFAALHLGAALAHPDVRVLATYDVHLARVAVLYGLDVVAPGLPDDWYVD